MSQFTAPGSVIGYVYQVRVALFWTLGRLREGRPFSVSIESLDDVSFAGVKGEPEELLQTKHHHKRTASLGDASPDLWKTLRVWADGTSSGEIPGDAALTLLTTATASDNSIAARLSTGSRRDVSLARQELDNVALSSSSEANKPAYAAYLALDQQARTQLLERVCLIDGAPSVVDLDQAIRHEVYWATTRDHLEAFLARLEGWWFRRVINQLTGGAGPIMWGEVEGAMSDLREQFKQDALPIDPDILGFVVDPATEEAHTEFTFVKQLELARAGRRRIVLAIQDYLRAFDQRSRWLREELVVGVELGLYERKLVDEWERVFEAMRDEVGTPASEERKEQAAQQVLKWAEQKIHPIRPGVDAPFVSRGSLHMLANECRVGWHLEFRERLSKLLADSQAVT